MDNLKKYLMIATAMLLVIFAACEKTDTDPIDDFTEVTSTCRIDKIVRAENGSTDILTFGYTENNDTLRRVGVRRDGEVNDYEVTEVTFNEDGSIYKIEDFDITSNPDFLLRSYTYTYSGDKIVTITELRNDATSPYTRTHVYTYNGDMLASIAQSGDPDGENMKLTNIVYENGNMKSADFDFDGTGLVVAKVTATSDDKFNHVKHLLPLPEAMMERFNNNNVVSVQLAEDVNVGIQTVPAGSKILDRVYTYNDNNEVATKTDKPGFFDDSGSNRVWTITYLCE